MIDTDKYEGHLIDKAVEDNSQVGCWSKWLLKNAENIEQMNATAELLKDAPLLLEEVKRLRERVKTEKNLKLWEKAEVKRLRALSVYKELEAEDIKKISSTYQAWKNNNVNYVDELAFCKSASIKEIIDYKYTLAPGRYVGFVDEHDTGESTSNKIKRLMNEYEKRRKLINQYESTFLSAIGEIGK